MKKTDVVILGAGPVGLFAGYYCGMRQLKALIVDQLELPGGQLTALYPEKKIYDVAGFEEIGAQELVNNQLEQLKRFQDTTQMILGEQILEIDKVEERKFIIKTTNTEIEAKSIIIAGGNGGFTPRKLGLENEDQFDNINYFISNTSQYENKKVAIFGGGDSAVDFALLLEKIAKEVHIIHRRDEFRAHAHTVELLKKSTVQVHTPYTPKELIGENNQINKIKIENKNKEEKEIEVDNVVCNFGFISKLGPIADFGLEIEKNRIKVDTAQRTNIPGITAIGDICTYDGKANLIISGYGEGPIAVNSSVKYIDPEAVIGTLHSTSVIGNK